MIEPRLIFFKPSTKDFVFLKVLVLRSENLANNSFLTQYYFGFKRLVYWLSL